MNNMMRLLFMKSVSSRILVLLCTVLFLHGCFSYTSSYIADPTSRKTAKGLDPAAEVTRRPMILVEGAPSAEDPAVPVTVRAVERASGPEAETTTVDEYKYKRQWSPLLIPVGVFQLVVTPFICLGAGLDANPDSKALDTLFAGMNDRDCEVKGFARMGTYFVVGIHPTCEVRASTTKKEKRLTGQTITEDRPYKNAQLRMAVYPLFSSEASASAKVAEVPSRTLDLDAGGRAKVNVAALFEDFPRVPRTVDLAFAFEGSQPTPEKVVIDERTSEALYLPVREERAAEQAERDGKKMEALEHYGKAYASLADKVREPILWKKIYMLYQALPAKPSPSDAARRSMSRGQAAVESAKSAQDFDSAIRELEQATLNAPAWPDAYYNLGMVQGKLERYDEAIRNLQKYLDLASTAGDAEQVKTMIYQMEYRKEKAAKPHVPARTGQ